MFADLEIANPVLDTEAYKADPIFQAGDVKDLERDDITLNANIVSKAIELVDDNFQNPMSQDYVFVEMCLRVGALLALDSQYQKWTGA